ncbi:MAG: hypothetical protein GXY77_09900 [Fibrobacter sp.]|nr:hypothetical protein [Fibrobacter sp.]
MKKKNYNRCRYRYRYPITNILSVLDLILNTNVREKDSRKGIVNIQVIHTTFRIVSATT